MQPSLTLITPTGGRPEAFALCERWMARQQYDGEVRWVVVDDGPEATPYTMGQTYIRPRPLWQPGQNTQSRNLVLALPYVKHDRVLIIEDDDYYGPHYLDLMAERLTLAQLVGERETHYYHIPSRQWRNCRNGGHGSLFQVGMRGEYLQAFERGCKSGNQFIDLHFFRDVKRARMFAWSGQSIGIKGLPGRPGIGMGHRPRGQHWQADPDLAQLRDWIGDDIEAYRQWL